MTSNTINYDPVSMNYPTSATNHYVTNQGSSGVAGVSNSGKSFRDGTPSINTNSNRNCKLANSSLNTPSIYREKTTPVIDNATKYLECCTFEHG